MLLKLCLKKNPGEKQNGQLGELVLRSCDAFGECLKPQDPLIMIWLPSSDPRVSVVMGDKEMTYSNIRKRYQICGGWSVCNPEEESNLRTRGVTHTSTLA